MLSVKLRSCSFSLGLTYGGPSMKCSALSDKPLGTTKVKRPVDVRRRGLHYTTPSQKSSKSKRTFLEREAPAVHDRSNDQSKVGSKCATGQIVKEAPRAESLKELQELQELQEALTTDGPLNVVERLCSSLGYQAPLPPLWRTRKDTVALVKRKRRRCKPLLSQVLNPQYYQHPVKSRGHILQDDDPLTVRARAILWRLMRATPMPHSWVLMQLFVDPKCRSGGNANWLGRVYINASLVHHRYDDHMVAFILAHEYAHVLAQHSLEILYLRKALKLIPTTTLLCSLIAAAATFGESLQEAEHIAIALAPTAVAAVAAYLVLPKRIRTHEYEADRMSMILMARAGFDATAMPVMLRELAKGRAYVKQVSFEASHPSARERIYAGERFLPFVMKYLKRPL